MSETHTARIGDLQSVVKESPELFEFFPSLMTATNTLFIYRDVDYTIPMVKTFRNDLHRLSKEPELYGIINDLAKLAIESGRKSYARIMAETPTANITEMCCAVNSLFLSRAATMKEVRKKFVQHKLEEEDFELLAKVKFVDYFMAEIMFLIYTELEDLPPEGANMIIHMTGNEFSLRLYKKCGDETQENLDKKIEEANHQFAAMLKQFKK